MEVQMREKLEEALKSSWYGLIALRAADRVEEEVEFDRLEVDREFYAMVPGLRLLLYRDTVLPEVAFLSYIALGSAMRTLQEEGGLEDALDLATQGALALGCFLSRKVLDRCATCGHRISNEEDLENFRSALSDSAKAVNVDFTRKFLAHSLSMFPATQPHWLTQAVKKIGLGAARKWLAPRRSTNPLVIPE